MEHIPTQIELSSEQKIALCEMFTKIQAAIKEAQKTVPQIEPCQVSYNFLYLQWPGLPDGTFVVVSANGSNYVNTSACDLPEA